MDLTIRAFEDSDYKRLAEIEAAIDPDVASSADLLRERDAVREPRVRLLHLAAEADGGGLVAAGRVMHIWWNFNPRNYLMGIVVDPRWQRRGAGSALLERLLEELRSWNAAVVRTATRDYQPEAIAFLEHRGFREWRRRWESVLEVDSANVSPLIASDRRVASKGVTITTYPEQRKQRGDQLAHDVWQLEDEIFRAESDASEGEGMSFERFVATELEWSEALLDAHFLAYVGDAFVGVSRLARDKDRPGRLDQALTGTHPRFRGLGIAHALKLHTIEFARQHGYREIRTSNDSTNEPMLHINQTIGFRRGPAMIVFERRMDT